MTFHSQEPDIGPIPEQTCSWASFLIFSFIDSTVYLAYRVPHLAYDQLPSLADYDYTEHLVRRSYPVGLIVTCGFHCTDATLALGCIRRSQKASHVLGTYGRLWYAKDIAAVRRTLINPQGASSSSCPSSLYLAVPPTLWGLLQLTAC